MHVADQPYLTPDAYLEWEARQPARHEYVAGEIFAMVGTTQRHNLIEGSLYMALRQHLRGRPCQVFVEAIKLRVAKANAYYYPDVMVACGEHRHVAGDGQVVDDPIIVVEILSPSSEATDRREKLAAYRSLPTLEEYLIVDQERQQAELYRRRGDIGWTHLIFEAGDTLELASIGLDLPLAALYEGTDIASEG